MTTTIARLHGGWGSAWRIELTDQPQQAPIYDLYFAAKTSTAWDQPASTEDDWHHIATFKGDYGYSEALRRIADDAATDAFVEAPTYDDGREDPTGAREYPLADEAHDVRFGGEF